MTRVMAGFDRLLEPRKYQPRTYRIDRLSVVWLDRNPDLGAVPMFAHNDDGVWTTIIAVWTTDADGSLDRGRLQDVHLMRWDLSEGERSALAEHHACWPTGLYDVSVTVRGGLLDLAPRQGALYAIALASDSPAALAVVARIRTEVARLVRAITSEAA